MKIDINEIRTYCENQLESRAACGDLVNLARQDAFSEVLDLLDRMEQGMGDIEDEPQGLDEAAKNYSLEKYGKTLLEPVEDFKAEAKWMAGLGVTCGGRIMKSSTGETYAESDYVPLEGKCGDRVIVQIRRVNESK